MKKKTLILNVLVAVVIGFLSYSTASATAIVTYTDSVNGFGTRIYTMTIKNADPDKLYDFKVNTGSIVPLDGGSLGVGWNPTEVGTDFVHWMADINFEIPSGDSMDGFWFTYSGTASDRIGSLSFETTTCHGDPSNCDYITLDINGYTSPATTPVPETETFWFTLTGLTLLGLGQIFKLQRLL